MGRWWELRKRGSHRRLFSLFFYMVGGAYQNLFMLVSALMGLERMKAAYAYAIENDYRFYSYGDASLLLP